jgi:hypothetical protein
MRRYRVLLPLKVQPREGGSYEQHEEFDADFTEDEETENVRSGLLAVVPVRYRVLVGDVFETPAGEEFEAALPMGNEALLIEGGHIERVEWKPAATTTKKKEK